MTVRNDRRGFGRGLWAAWLLMAATSVNAEDSTTPPQRDLERLQGEWVAKAGPNGDIDVRVVVKDQDVRFRAVLPSGLVVEAKGRVKMDESAQPTRLDWTRLKTKDGQSLPDIPGIYRLESDATRLTVCTGGPLGTRPKAFEAGDSVLAALVTFERPAEEVVATTESGTIKR